MLMLLSVDMISDGGLFFVSSTISELDYEASPDSDA